MPGEKVYPGSNGNGAATELSPPPRDYYNISVKDQIYGTAPQPASYRNKSKRRKCKCKNPCYVGNCNPCRCCWWWLVVLILLIVITGVVFYVVVRPKVPDYQLIDFRLTGLDSSLASQQLSTTSDLVIRARNDNSRMSFDYKSIQVHVSTKTGGVSVGDGSIPNFYHGTGQTANVTGSFKATPMAIGKDTQSALVKAQSTGNLPLKLKVDLRSRLKLGSTKFVKLKIKVRCDVSINPKVTSGSQILNKKCATSGRPYF